MKLKNLVCVAGAICGLFTLVNSASAQGTAFTYQGQLNDGANPVSGSYDLAFTLFATNIGGAAIAGPVTNAAVAVNNGLFTTTVNFGNAFAGASNWLQIAVSVNGSNSFAPLMPRQQITPTPYAVYASSAGAVMGLTVQNNLHGAPNVISGSTVNFVSGGVVGATISGGGATNYSSGLAYTNGVTDDFGTVGGGGGNLAGNFGTVGGGFANVAGGQFATVGGGVNNHASGGYATVGGGLNNLASFTAATIGGGQGNTASGYGAVVPGGVFNTASGFGSFAAGESAQAAHDFSFVWNDGTAFSSTTTNQFSVHAAGGILLAADVQMGTSASDYHHFTLGGGNSLGFLYGSYPKFQDFVNLGYNYYADAKGNQHIANTGGATSRVAVGYGEVIVAVGGVNAQPTTTRIDVTTSGVSVYGTFNNNSDRNAKENFASISAADILEKVSSLPVSEWSYKEDAATRHLGPMAQDFYSTFNVGTDEKHIAPIDEGGVALAAIQGLNEKLTDELKLRDAENADLKSRLEKLERLVTKLSESGANKKVTSKTASEN